MHRSRVSFVAAAIAAVACAQPRIVFPTGVPTPTAEALAQWTAATEACGGARVFTAEITADGLVGTERLRQVVLQGAMTRGGELRLLAVAPAGPPIFILAGRDERATLTLPRERRVLVAPAADIVAALIGLRLTAMDWLSVMSGCVAPAAAAEGGVIGGVTIVRLADGTTRVRLDKDGRDWRLTAGQRADLLVEYREFQGRWPRALQVSTPAQAPVAVGLSMSISQVNVNIDLSPRAFALDVPADYRPMTLDELRAMGPLGERGVGGTE